MKGRAKGFLSILKSSFTELDKNDPLRLAGATAFFTTFALPAVLLIILQLIRLILPGGKSDRELYGQIKEFVGEGAAEHLFNVLKGFESFATNPIAMTAGVVFLLFVATTLFKVIKNSLNEIWDIRVVEKKSFRLTITMRARELAIILAAGILFLVTLFLEGIQSIASDEFLKSSGFTRIALSTSVSFVISVIVVTVWFGLIFSFLPDGRIAPRICFIGAIVTSILFNVGKLVLRYILLEGNVQQIFGASASVVLLLLFVFYSAHIFYFGAAFTKIMALTRKVQIKPLDHAVLYELKESDPREKRVTKKPIS